MQISDRAFLGLKRAQIWTGAIPVGLFLLSHLATNARAIAGAQAFDRGAEWIGRLPYLATIELLAIALPMLLHVVLGIALGTTAQAAEDRSGYARPGMLLAQRASGFFLVVYVAFHVWGTRLSPERQAGGRDLFGLMAQQLSHPGMLAFHAAGLMSGAFHFGNGLVGLMGPWGWNAGPRGRAVAERVGLAAFVMLTLLGLQTLLAFVHPAFRWLEPRLAP